MFPDFEPAPSAPGPYRVALHGYDALAAGLVAAARAGAGAQAYLVAGPPAVGKRTLARLIAQALLCAAEPPGARPCGRCRACRLVAQGGWADLHVVPPPLRIDQARELQRELALTPGEADHRVAVVPEIELASAGAANSLLKLLEEPPRQAVLILTTAAIGDVLPTIQSRCRIVTMRPLAAGVVAEALERHWDVEEDRARLLARLSGGRLGWAVRALAEPAHLERRAAWLDHLHEALGADRAGRMDLAGQWTKAEGDALPDGLSVWGSWWRDLLLLHHGLDAPIVNRDRLDELRAARRRFGPSDAVRALRSVEEALRRLAANTQPLLTLEVLCLELPS